MRRTVRPDAWLIGAKVGSSRIAILWLETVAAYGIKCDLANDAITLEVVVINVKEVGDVLIGSPGTVGVWPTRGPSASTLPEI